MKKSHNHLSIDVPTSKTTITTDINHTQKTHSLTFTQCSHVNEMATKENKMDIAQISYTTITTV